MILKAISISLLLIAINLNYCCSQVSLGIGLAKNFVNNQSTFESIGFSTSAQYSTKKIKSINWIFRLNIEFSQLSMYSNQLLYDPVGNGLNYPNIVFGKFHHKLRNIAFLSPIIINYSHQINKDLIIQFGAGFAPIIIPYSTNFVYDIATTPASKVLDKGIGLHGPIKWYYDNLRVNELLEIFILRNKFSVGIQTNNLIFSILGMNGYYYHNANQQITISNLKLNLFYTL
jgi:hypothetical protein